ncbi:DinB family protein [Saccharopolyspora erythraea]|uniref:DinB family protein n=1 Tax=Saccharopolyspora erythraea TaxID=1836 RepID=UPI001BA5BA79|nr:DinB family protein [Saccharopolyspora erythraea]QUG99717.1 DinB family protein [Saccharopolyspora erythraea]
MPTLVRAAADDRDALVVFLEEQRASLRRAVHGLDDEQAAARPVPSSDLCLGGLVKHVANAERNWVDIVAGRPSPARDWSTEFGMAPEETLADLLTRYRKISDETAAVFAGISDLDRALDIGPLSALIPDGTERTPRWVLSHLIQETARHAGHADILREALDGSTAADLVEATGTPFFT